MTDRRRRPGPPARHLRVFSRVYPIVDADALGEADPSPVLTALAAAGVATVQLRAKKLTPAAFFAWARAGIRAASSAGLRVIVNDRADVALLAGAAGAHLGQEDLSPRRARDLLGADAILGVSTHSPRQVREAARAPVDYLAIGPVYPTTTKAGADPAVGLAGVRAARAAWDGPLVAIGGISGRRIPAVLASGADAVAVVGALGRDRGRVGARAACLLRLAGGGPR